MAYSGAWGKLIHEKNQKSKISWHCPFNPGLSGGQKKPQLATRHPVRQSLNPDLSVGQKWKKYHNFNLSLVLLNIGMLNSLCYLFRPFTWRVSSWPTALKWAWSWPNLPKSTERNLPRIFFQTKRKYRLATCGMASRFVMTFFYFLYFNQKGMLIFCLLFINSL